jgi:ketosteroid isomerase-like protein
MSREEAIGFVAQLGEAVNAHDTRRLLEFYADEAVTVSPVFGGIAGKAAIAKSWDDIFSLFPDWAVRITDVLVDGDRIAFMGTAGATDQNGWFGQAATRERIDYRAVIVLTMAHGKIVRDERIYDLTGVLQRLEKARLDKELAVAAEVQRALLSRTRHLTEYCEAVGDSLPCRAIGGDFFELVHLPSGDFAVALGDISGKGPASAILAAMIQGMLAVEVQTESSPSAIMARLNRSLAGRSLEPRFATLVYGVLSANGRFVYSNAGHNPPLMLTRNGLRRLTVGGPILGAFGESSFEEETISLSGADTIIMFSDGVTEALDAEGREFGEDRLASCVTASGTNSAPDMLRGILKCVQDFCKGTAQTDDITVAVARFHGL